MTANPLGRAEQVPGLLDKAGVDADARPAVPAGAGPRAAVEALAAASATDAAKLLAFAMPRREAAWWACVSARASLTNETPPEEKAAVQAAERWVANPTEEHRRAAEAAATAAGFGTPGGLAALAAFWSGGSIAPPTVAAVPPAEHLLPTAVGNAVLLAATVGDPAGTLERTARFVTVGLEVADGRKRWPEDKPQPVAAKPPPPPRRY